MKNTSIPRQYVLDEKNKKVAVMLDIKTFDKIEEALENYGLMQFINENKSEKPLKAAEAKLYYSKLSKGK
ncbi:MAG: hypothetical protein ABI855_12080 [Bacteroidota bacterium]